MFQHELWREDSRFDIRLRNGEAFSSAVVITTAEGDAFAF